MGFETTERFTLRGELGRGGMGIVYAAYDRERQTEVALKTVAEINPASIFRIKREFRALADVNHPNLISLYELASDSGQWFFTMELLSGVDILTYVRGGHAPATGAAETSGSAPHPSKFPSGDIKATVVITATPTLVDRTGDTAPSLPEPGAPTGKLLAPANEGLVRSAFLQLAEGVSALHTSGHLHRDIKPSNVVVTPERRVVLLDFGVITELRQLTTAAAEVPAGTPAYMAPEQADRTRTLTEASDWYSVGVILYEALAGCRPFRGDSRRILADKRNRRVTSPQLHRPDAPADLCELCMALLEPDPGQRPSANEIKAGLRDRGGYRASPPVDTAPSQEMTFVGREAELAALRGAFAATEQGIGSLLYVAGESGMGKSVLVRHFLDEVSQDRSTVVLEGRCYQRESVPYKAVDSVVDALCVFLLGLPDHEAELLLPRDVQMLARVFPVLDRVDSVRRSKQPGSAAPDPHEVKRRAFRALRELLGRLAERRPVVVFIDDLQWGDVDSAPLIDGLMRPPDQPPLLLLCCYRSEERERSALLRALFRRDRRVGPASTEPELRIGALDHAEAATLARTLAENAELTIDAETMAREAGGHPYFIHELVRQASSDPVAPHDAVTLDGVISSRAAQLPDQARLALELIAVAARPIAQSVVKEAARLESSSLLEMLHILQSARLVRTSGTLATDLVEPFHDRIRETIVLELSAETLRHHHHVLASALQTSHVDAETLAAHYRASGEDATAARYAIRAADQAAEALAFEQAANLYQLAIDALGREPLEDSHTMRDTHALRIKLADALANAGHGPKAALAYSAAVAGANTAEAIELRRCAALQYLRAGHIDQGLEVIAEVLASMGLSLPRTLRGSLVSLLYHRARLRIRGLGFRPRDISQITAEELCRIDTCWSVALGLAMVDTYRCADFQTRNVLLALRAGEPYRVARALSLEVGIVCTGGPKTRPRALEIIAKARRIAEEVGEPEVLGWVEAVTSLTQYSSGLYGSALEHAEKAITIWRGQCTGVSWELTSAELFRLWSLFYLGELREMLQRLESLLEEARTRGDLYTLANLCSGLPNLALLMTGRVDEAETLLVEALAKWSRKSFHLQHYWGHLAHAHLELYRGEAEAAYQRMNEALRGLKRSMMLRIQSVRHEATHLRARAALAVAATDPSRKDCLRQAARDARRLAREGTAVATALSLLIRAGIATIRDGAEVAIAALERAEAAATAAELGFYAIAARRQRGVLIGGDPGDLLIVGADDWLTGQGVVDPAGIVAVFVPGLPS